MFTKIKETKEAFKTKEDGCKPSALSDLLDRNEFDIADEVIKKAYPDIWNKGNGWWGAKRIPNWGILRGAIAKAIFDEREKRSND